MSIPEILTQIIAEAEESLLKNPVGELTLPIRKQIWAAMGELNSEVGKKRRTKLAKMCVEHAFQVWDFVHPPEKHPKEILNLIDAYFDGKIDDESMREEYDIYSVKMDNLSSRDLKYQLAAGVGTAACQALFVARHDECFGEVDEYPDATEEGMDPDEWDAAFYISIAVAGPKWIEGASIEKRRQFWNWYLDEAVPQAYNAFSK